MQSLKKAKQASKMRSGERSRNNVALWLHLPGSLCEWCLVALVICMAERKCSYEKEEVVYFLFVSCVEIETEMGIEKEIERGHDNAMSHKMLMVQNGKQSSHVSFLGEETTLAVSRAWSLSSGSHW